MTKAEMKARVLKRLKDTGDMEMMQHEIEQLLEEELHKSESEMDTQLIQELLDALEEDVPEGARQRSWDSLERALKTVPHVGRRGAKVWIRWAVISAAALIAVVGLSVGSAYAFNWTSFLKILKPLEETFSIHSVSTQTVPEVEPETEKYGVVETEFVQQQYDTLDDFPSEWNGVRILPGWMPEDLDFIQGSVYQGSNMTVLDAIYQGGDRFMNLSVMFAQDDDDTSAYSFEKSVTMLRTETVGTTEITYYINSDIDLLSASWIGADLHFVVFGNVTEEEIQQIVYSMVE